MGFLFWLGATVAGSVQLFSLTIKVIQNFRTKTGKVELINVSPALGRHQSQTINPNRQP